MTTKKEIRPHFPWKGSFLGSEEISFENSQKTLNFIKLRDIQKIFEIV